MILLHLVATKISYKQRKVKRVRRVCYGKGKIFKKILEKVILDTRIPGFRFLDEWLNIFLLAQRNKEKLC